MQITITNQGVIFQFVATTNKRAEITTAALQTARICGWKVRGLRALPNDTYMAVITRTSGAAYQREMFADRLAFEAGLRGVAAEVVA